MAREITSGELVKLRSDGQQCRLYLAIELAGTVYSARVNQATFADPVSQVTFDGGSGTLGNVKAGMTLMVGSSAGGYDKGICRVRKAPSATVFYVGLESEVVWADNLYLTVLDDVNLWQRAPSTDGLMMDYEIGYSDQHDDLDPVAVMGPDAALKLSGESVTHQRDASDSWALGGTIASYAWTATGPAAVGIDNAAIADPTFTITQAGWYRIGLTVTADNGKTATGYRKTYVYDSDNMPADEFALESCGGDVDRGGWSFTVRMYDDAALSQVRDRAKVLLIAEDIYSGEAGSIGPLSGYENVVASGWIDGETIDWNPDYSSVRFEVKGPAQWLGQIMGAPVNLTNSASSPTSWSEFEGLTTDKAIWHLLHWQSTATAVMDVFLTGDTRQAPTLSAAGESIWEQVRDMAEMKLLASPLCDRYGRMYVEIDTQVVPSGDRSGFPTVMTLTKDDWSDMRIERVTRTRVSALDLSGEYYDGSTSTVLLSRAAGKIAMLYGREEAVDDLLLSSQSQANTLAGDLLAWRNNAYEHIDIEIPANNRMMDICPRQYLVLNVASGDTARGVTFTSQNVIVREMELVFDEAGYLTAQVTAEAETVGLNVGETVPYSPPPTIGTLPIDFEPYELPDFGMPKPFPAITPTFPPYEPVDPQIPPEEGATCPTDAPANGPYDLHISGTVINTGSYYGKGKLRGMVRTSGHSNRTTYEINARWQELVDGAWVDTDDDTWYNVYALGPSGTVATESKDAVSNSHKRTGTLDAATTTLLDTLVVQLHSSLLVRPTGAPTVWWARDFTNLTGYITGGASGGGYYALSYGNYGAKDVWSFFRLAAMFPGISGPVLLHQTAYASVVGATQAAISSLTGGYVPNPAGVIGYWNIGEADVYGPTTLLSAAEAYTMTQNPSSGVGIQARYHWTGTHALTMYQTMHLYRPATKRIIVESVKLYNLCPPEA